MSNISLIFYLFGLTMLILGINYSYQYYKNYNEIKSYNKFLKVNNGGIIEYIDVDNNNNIIVQYKYNNKVYRTFNLLGNNFKNRLDAIIYVSKINKNPDVYINNNLVYLELNKEQDLEYPIKEISFIMIGLLFIYLGNYVDNFISNTIKSFIKI